MKNYEQWVMTHDGELVEPQHVHDAYLREYGCIQIRPLVRACRHQQAAIRAALHPPVWMVRYQVIRYVALPAVSAAVRREPSTKEGSWF